MAGKIIADTIETGAGADISTSYVVNGSAKAWYMLDGTGTISLRDSLNIASTTDDGTGLYSVSFSSNMSAANYGITTGANYLISSFVSNLSAPADTYATSGFAVEARNSTLSTTLDYDYISTDIKGDLA